MEKSHSEAEDCLFFKLLFSLDFSLEGDYFLRRVIVVLVIHVSAIVVEKIFVNDFEHSFR